MALTPFRTVRVSLHALKFPYALRKIDDQIISELVTVFHRGGVKKDIPNNIILADIADLPGIN